MTPATYAMTTYQKTLSLDEVAEEGVKDEYNDYVVYHHLAESHRLRKREHAKKLADIFEELSKTEYSHYEFWKK